MDMEPEPQIQNGDFTLAVPTSSGRFTKQNLEEEKKRHYLFPHQYHIIPKKKHGYGSKLGTSIIGWLILNQTFPSVVPQVFHFDPHPHRKKISISGYGYVQNKDIRLSKLEFSKHRDESDEDSTSLLKEITLWLCQNSY